MIVYPAMDLMGGRCVRLAQGNFDQATHYASDPAEALAAFAAEGAEWAHVVDLDGARAGAPRQHDLIAELASNAPLKIQAAGGVRSADHVARLLHAGAARVVIGSLAVQQPETVRDLSAKFGRYRITIALDVRVAGGTPLVATHGWAEESRLSLYDVASMFDGGHMLVTDISRDGMLSGPNLDLIREAASRLTSWEVQASGGVSDAPQLRELWEAGAAGAIVGKALWEGRFSIEEALAYAGA